MNDQFNLAKSLSRDLNSGTPVDFEALYKYFEVNGKVKTMETLTIEYIGGGNAIYQAHLRLAMDAVTNS